MADVTAASAPWILPTDRSIENRNWLGKLERALDNVPEDARHTFSQLGLDLAPRTPIEDGALRRAGDLISSLPDLWNVVAARVDCVAILRSADDCFDVSHSDPAWPGLVLVSVPPASPVGDLRLAEGIIHEAMHHHLSAYEEEADLVAIDSRYYSPWKESDRPVGGVLHGLYVFGCIAFALDRLRLASRLDASQATHARRRIAEIAEEFDFVDHQALRSALTEAGRSVHDRAIDGLRSASVDAV